MSLLDGLKDNLTNPLRVANDEIAFEEAMEFDCALEAATNARLSDEDVAAILGGEDDIPSDEDPEEGGEEALIEETAIECFCASAYLYNDIAEEGVISDLTDKFKNWWANRKDRKQGLKARKKMREEQQFRLARLPVDELIDELFAAAKPILVDMSDREISDAKRKIQMDGSQRLAIKKKGNVRMIAVINEDNTVHTMVGCIDAEALNICLKNDPYKEGFAVNPYIGEGTMRRYVIEFDIEMIAILVTMPIVLPDGYTTGSKVVQESSFESFLNSLDGLPSAEGETPEEVMAATEAMLSRLPIEEQIYLDDVATEGLKEKITELKDKHAAKKLDNAKVTVMVDKLKGMKPDSVIRKFVTAAKPILLPMQAEDLKALRDDSEGAYIKVSGIDIVYYAENDVLTGLYAAVDPSKTNSGRKTKSVWGKSSKTYTVDMFRPEDIAKVICNPIPVVQAAAEEGWDQDGIDPDSPVMEHLLAQILSQR